MKWKNPDFTLSLCGMTFLTVQALGTTTNQKQWIEMDYQRAERVNNTNQ